MHVARLLHRPLALLLAAEVALLAGTGIVAWRAWHHRSPAPPPPAATSALMPPRPPAPSRSTPQVPPQAALAPAARSHGPTPGLRRDSAFVTGQLERIDREEAALEQAEWHLLSSLVRAARSYVERVVLPAIARAQAEGR